MTFNRQHPLLSPEEQVALSRLRMGQRLRRRREELRVSLREVAEVLGCTTQFVGDLERGVKSVAEPAAWIALADILQLDSLRLLREVCTTRSHLSVSLPAEGPGREALLALIVELSTSSQPVPQREPKP